MTNGQGLQLIEPLRSLYKDEVRGTYPFHSSLRVGAFIIRPLLAYFTKTSNCVSTFVNAITNVAGQISVELSGYQSTLL